MAYIGLVHEEQVAVYKLCVHILRESIVIVQRICAVLLPETESGGGLAQSVRVGEVRAFVWNTFDSAVPLAEPKSISFN